MNRLSFAVILVVAVVTSVSADGSDAVPLPSWREGATKAAIVNFVKRVTDPNGPDFVPEAERIATFDNDGTLWCEQPVYTQAVFALDRAREMAAADPTLKEKPAFAAILSNDRVAMAKFGEHELAELVAATHTGMSPEAFVNLSRQWLKTAEHPRFRRPYTSCVYQPQIELLHYLRASGFKTFIVTGGGIDFVRAFSQECYRIPPEQVVGSSTKTRFDAKDDKGELVKLSALNSVDDGPGKPMNINLHIGRRPILAFGNSDGDLAMLEYTYAGKRPSLMLLVHHDDPEREYAYDRQSRVGKLDKALDAAARSRWTVVSMKDDWASIFPPEPPRP